MSEENNERDSASGSNSDESKTEDFSIFDTPPSSVGSSSNNRIDYPALAEAVNDDDDAIVPAVEELDSTGAREDVSMVAENIPSTSGGEPSKEYSVEIGSLLDVGAVTEIEASCDNSGTETDLEGKLNKTDVSTSQERSSSETGPKKRSSFGWRTTSSDGSELSPENRPSSSKRYFQPELSKDFPGSFEVESAASYSKTSEEGASGTSGENSSTRLETSVQQERVSYGARPKKRSSFYKKTSSSNLSDLSPENRPSPPKKYTPELSVDVSGRFPKKSSVSCQSKITMVDDSLNCPQSEAFEEKMSKFKSSFIAVLGENPERLTCKKSSLNTFEDDNNNSMEGFSEGVPHQESKLLESNNFMVGLLGDFPERVEYSESSLGSLQASVDHSYDVSERVTEQEGNLKKTKIVKDFFSSTSSSVQPQETDPTSKKSIDVEDVVKNILHPPESRPSWSNTRRNLAEVCPRPRHAERNVIGLDEFRQRFDKEVIRILGLHTFKILYDVSHEVRTEVEIPSTAGPSSLPPTRHSDQGESRGINWSLVYRTAARARDKIALHMLTFNQQNPEWLQLLHNLPNVPTQNVSFPGSSREMVVLTASRLQEDIEECVYRLISGNSEIARLSIAVFSFLFKSKQEKNFRLKLRNFNTAFHECLQTFCDILTTLQRIYNDCTPEDPLYKNLLAVNQACSDIIAQVYQVLILIEEIESVTQT